MNVSTARSPSPVFRATSPATATRGAALPPGLEPWRGPSIKHPSAGRPTGVDAQQVAERLLGPDGTLLRYDSMLSPYAVLKQEILAPGGRLADDGRALHAAFGLTPLNVGHLSDHVVRLSKASALVFTVPARTLVDQPMDVLEADLPYVGPNGTAGALRTTWRPVFWGPARSPGGEPSVRLQMVSAAPRTA